ncbi:hypothetical protein [Protaetiibacter larvae]|uniref:Uncharacterized protein n=1 Tax=Protaetiibacter larvae TaxID=2592654 RepID=A0A5C1Y4J3_9MICO|nr:hypothetical protein [Protaetiibacter larvae]QEO08794.1 hypothetical protein FLP23_01430 [Protaetiibacter larvae]
MTDKPNYRQPGGTPTEYGGRSGDNRRTPTGRLLPGSTGQQAADLRREAIRTANPSRRGYGQRLSR